MASAVVNQRDGRANDRKKLEGNMLAPGLLQNFGISSCLWLTVPKDTL